MLISCLLIQNCTLDIASRGERLDNDESTEPGITSTYGDLLQLHLILLSCPIGPSGRSAHGSFGMIIDQSSIVMNGNVPGGKAQAGSRIHVAHGGSVTNNSMLLNGDMDRETFLGLMCSK